MKFTTDKITKVTTKVHITEDELVSLIKEAVEKAAKVPGTAEVEFDISQDYIRGVIVTYVTETVE